MALTFTRARPVEPGQKITSEQYGTLARAINDRLRSGVADGPWRIFFYFLGMFRQVRNSDETGFAFPSLGEFFEIYQHLNVADAEWPVTGPGDPEGLNVASQMNAFVHGAEAFQVYPEWERFADLIFHQGQPSAEACWEAAKLQRGAVDDLTGALGSPAFLVAWSHYAIRYSNRSPHGMSYGGWKPSPEQGLTCAPLDSGVPQPPNYKAKYTNRTTGDVIEFSGSCAPTSFDPYDTDVAVIVRKPWAHYVLQNNGTWTVFRMSQWFEGPYTGEGRLEKTENDAIERVMNAFVSEFRGTQQQRADPKYDNDNAFDFQRFFTSQYHLAPQRGFQSQEFVVPDYPTFELGIPQPVGTMLYLIGGGESRKWTENFVFSAALLKATGLSSAITLDVLDNGEVIDQVTLVPDEGGGGTAARIWMPRDDWTPQGLAFRCATPLQGAGVLRIECTELMRYRPQMQDAYVIIRASGCLETQPDGVGINETDADILSEDYFNFGCIVNRAGLPGIPDAGNTVSRNAVWDAARRMSKWVRLLRRQELVGYAVEGGKSVFFFKRYAFGLHKSTPADAWDGIAPNRERLVPGDIVAGKVYEVRGEEGEWAEYNGTKYLPGTTFTGIKNVIGWTGDGDVYEHEGLVHTALPDSETNEWLLGIEFKAYHPSYSSIWKTDAYSDYYPIHSRCMYAAPEVANDKPLLWHIGYGERFSANGTVVSEAPSGYTYAMLDSPFGGNTHVNQLGCDELDTACQEFRRNFYKSCRIYEPDPEIESVTILVENGEEIVKAVMKTRIHHCDTAPASIDRDRSGWDITALQKEQFRSWENAVREYLYNQDSGQECTTTWPGNNGINSTIQSDTDNPFGSCYPHFRLTKLIPEPRADSNDKMTSEDTRFDHQAFRQMEVYLRAMCEGYVDGETTQRLACEFGVSSVYDFTWENVCFRAFGDNGLNSFTLDDRPRDHDAFGVPAGYGVMPNTTAAAEVFNRYVAVVNLLVSARVMMPAEIQTWSVRTTRQDAVQGLDGNSDSAGACVGGGTAQKYWIENQPEIPAIEWGSEAWVAGSGAVVASASGMDGDCIGSLHEQTIYAEGVRFRWSPTDPDMVHALPSDIVELLTLGATVYAQLHYIDGHTTRRWVATSGEAEPCNFPEEGPTPVFPVDGGGYLDFVSVTTRDEYECTQLVGEYLSGPLPFSQNWYALMSDRAICGAGSSTSVTIEVLSVGTPVVTVPLVDVIVGR